MDIATIIGVVGAFTLIIVSIAMGSPLSAFIDIPSLVVVVGGTIMTTLTMQRLKVVLGAFKVAINAFKDKSLDNVALIDRIIDLTYKAKRGGVLVLDNEDIPEEFLARGVQMAVDGIEIEEIRASLETDLNGVVRRHKVGQKVFKFMGASAPAMGMIGTLIGLVQMLGALDDPASIGPAMAVALLTTFYGAVLAFMVFNPIAEKLAERTDREKVTMTIVIEGVEGIAKGVSPRLLKAKLSAHLSPGERTSEDGAGGEAAAA
ncbi:MAG: MotA/TolQ/ExbB proton channel family protein [Candidatus Eisenbacteria bacterium]